MSAPIRMAMHIHSCFSEGGKRVSASMMTHLDQATRSGVDVIWWTEHDFRMQAYGYYRGIGFDGTDEGHDLSWHQQVEGEVTEVEHAFVSEPRSPAEQGKALLVAASGPADDWGYAYLWPKPGNWFYRANLTDTTVSLDVLAETVGSDAQAVVEIQTSYRPETGGRPAGSYVLEYRIAAEPDTTGSTDRRGSADRSLEGPLRGVVTVPRADGWQRLILKPYDDLRHFWPDIVAEDSSLYNIRFGVRARRGARGRAGFDHLRFDRGRDTEPLAWAPRLQRSLMKTYASMYPRVTQYASTEVSLIRHMNVFLPELALVEYAGPPVRDNAADRFAAMVEWYHERGAVVQYNHPFVDSAVELIAYKGFGADLIEIGRDAHLKIGPDGALTTLGQRIELYDVAARNGIFLTATGVTDDHDGDDWRSPDEAAQRYVTGVWASSRDVPVLLAALRGGRAYWHDLLLWPGGALDLAIGGRPVMGKAIRASEPVVEVTVRASALPEGSTLQVVAGDCDHGGPAPSIVTDSYPASDLVDSTADAGDSSSDLLTVRLERRSGRYLRVEVHDADGRVIGFSNPCWVLSPEAPTVVPAERELSESGDR